LNAASTAPDGDVCPAGSVRDGRVVDVGVAWVVGDFTTVFGVGVGFGGATVRVRVEGDVVVGSTVDELEFCANVRLAHEQTTEAMTRSLFIIYSSVAITESLRRQEL